jgi:hypothetical protein
MSWNLIKSIQKKTDLRLILPIGLTVKIGDIISVDRNGEFTHEGNCKSLLGIAAGKPLQEQNGKADLFFQSGRDTKFAFRAKAKASSLFPELPNANGGFDITLGKVDSWLLALKGRSLSSIREFNRLRKPILAAHARGVWMDDFAIVTSTGTVDKMTLLAADSSDTRVFLSLGARVDSISSLEIKLTSGVTLTQANKSLINIISEEPAVRFCRAQKVKSSFWRGKYVGTLGGREIPPPYEEDEGEATDSDFWQDIDELTD